MAIEEEIVAEYEASERRAKAKLSTWERAERAGKDSFQLETHYDNGKVFHISKNLRSYVQGLIALAWKRGYDAGRRSK